MKLTLLTDKDGRILAAHYRTPVSPVPVSARPAATKIRPLEGQSLHEVEVPPDLEQHLLHHTFAKEISNWRVEREGRAAKIRKIS